MTGHTGPLTFDELDEKPEFVIKKEKVLSEES